MAPTNVFLERTSYRPLYFIRYTDEENNQNGNAQIKELINDHSLKLCLSEW